ncbi:MAG TPA: acyl-CoA thioester hydrolase YciA [Buchnera sp. (in: enterobacteria)]|nr:acyl-CoA thioester hydrolase YciA [Buchnera sp. (in: enterobacteria)]
MEKKKYLPSGHLVLQTLAMPSNTNPNGDIFGGWLMSQMDIGGAILAKEISGGRVVTVRVYDMIFLKSVSVGDIVSCYAKCIKIGTSSIVINIEIWIKKLCFKTPGQFYCTAEAVFIYVAVDKKGKSRALLPMSIISANI